MLYRDNKNCITSLCIYIFGNQFIKCAEGLGRIEKFGKKAFMKTMVPLRFNLQLHIWPKKGIKHKFCRLEWCL